MLKYDEMSLTHISSFDFFRMHQFERVVLLIDLYFAFDLLHYTWKYTNFDEMFCLLLSCSNFDETFATIYVFRNFRSLFAQKYDEMLCLIHACLVIYFFTYVLIRTKCFFNWLLFRFRLAHYMWKCKKVLTKCLHRSIYFAIYDFVTFIDFFTWSNSDETFDDNMFRNLQSVRTLKSQNLVRCSTNHFVWLIRFTIFSYWFSNAFYIEIDQIRFTSIVRSNAFHIDDSIKNCFAITTFSLMSMRTWCINNN